MRVKDLRAEELICTSTKEKMMIKNLLHVVLSVLLLMLSCVASAQTSSEKEKLATLKVSAYKNSKEVASIFMSNISLLQDGLTWQKHIKTVPFIVENVRVNGDTKTVSSEVNFDETGLGVELRTRRVGDFVEFELRAKYGYLRETLDVKKRYKAGVSPVDSVVLERKYQRLAGENDLFETVTLGEYRLEVEIVTVVK